MATPDAPLVRIGLPTYNREGTLPRAIESALGQTHRNIELVISDNASDDHTERICRRYADADGRVRYLRQARNLGPTENFNRLFAECSQAPYALMLADDDWLDPDYVELCLAELQRSPGHVVVAGLARYYRGGEQAAEGVELQVQAEQPESRVLDFYSQVDDNGTFYGVIEGDALARVGPMCNDVGNDWFHVAGLAYLGKLRTIRATHVNRELGGTSETIEGIAEMFGKSSRLQARAPHLFLARYAFRDVASRSPLYRDLSTGARLRLAAGSALRTIDLKSLAWHLTAPTFARLGRRPRGRRVRDAYLRVTRALGSGRSRLG
jgi:glycosyltransferase involved in cell wall biosynthesis